MICSYQQWRKTRELNEAALARNLRPDSPFINLAQQQGDFVYFGVHDLSRFYSENGFLPRELPVEQVLAKAGQVIDADPVERTITVVTNRDPFHYGYRKLEDPNLRQKRKSKGDENRITIPINNLEQITHMMGNSGMLSGTQLWLVVDGNTSHQQKLMKEIRKKEVERTRTPEIVPQTQEITPDRLAKAKAWLTGAGDPTQVEPAKPTAATLFGPDPEQKVSPTLQKLLAQRRQKKAIQTNPADMAKRNQLRQGAFDQFGGQAPLDTASHDPSIISYGWHWKQHDDTRRYDYFVG